MFFAYAGFLEVPLAGAGGCSLKIAELEKELAQGKIRPAYLLAGDEPLLRDQGLAALSQGILGGAADEFNLERLDAVGLSPSVLHESLQTLPWMASHRLVILREPDQIKHKDTRESLFEALLEALERLVEQTETVLVVTANSADSRLRWVKAFKGPAVRVDCNALKNARDAIPFVEAEARRQGVELESGVARELAERTGPRLLVLQGEIAKAALLAGPGQPVSRDHVLVSTSDISESKLWDLTDPICAGQTGTSVTRLGRLLASGFAPEAILGALAGHFRRLATVRGGGSVGGGGFRAQQLAAQARRYSQRDLRTCLERIHETDAVLKGIGKASKQVSRELAVEILVMDLSP
jgi:DNA polymerase-3 subunit delta